MYINAARFVQDLRGLTPTEKAVAYTMAIHASPPPQFADSSPAGIANMSMALLARESGLESRETASRIVKRLVAIGILAFYGEPSKGGNAKGKQGGRTTAYNFTMTVKPDSGVWKTTAAEERAADATKSSVTQPSESPTSPTPSTPENDVECDSPVTLEPENRGECDSPVTLESENAKSTVTPQSHKGLPSGSFRSFSETCVNDADSGSTARGADDCGGSVSQAAAQSKGAPMTAEITQKDKNNPVVVGAERPLLSIESSGGECAPHAHPTSGHLAAPTSGVPLPHASPAAGLKPAHESQSQQRGQEEQYEANDCMEAEWRRRQLDRRLTNKQICDEFKFVFVRLCHQEAERATYAVNRRIKVDDKWFINPAFDQSVLDEMPKGIDLEWKNPLPKHQQAAAEYFKAVGRDVALANWKTFLLDGGDFEITQPIWNEEHDKIVGSDDKQQDWLLLLFVKEQTASVEGVKS